MKKLSEIENLLIEAVNKVRAERIALNLTQKEFAEFVDIKYSTYKSYEQSGKISFESYIKILIKLNKQEQFSKFLDGFEFNEQKERASSNNIKLTGNDSFEPIIKPSQKHIILDKEVFGPELFYSVDNGHTYEVQNFIGIILSNWNEKRLMLLIKYFGIDRLKPYILKQKDISLLKSFNRHMKFISKRV